MSRSSTSKRSGERLDSGSGNDLDLDAANVQTSDQPKEKKYKRFKLNRKALCKLVNFYK